MMSFPREEGGPVAALVKRKTHEMIFGSVTFHIFRDIEGEAEAEKKQRNHQLWDHSLVHVAHNGAGLRIYKPYSDKWTSNF